jgi:hypothetical protein
MGWPTYRQVLLRHLIKEDYGIANRSKSVELSAQMYRHNLESISHCILDITLEDVTNFQNGRKVVKPTLYTGVTFDARRCHLREVQPDSSSQISTI